MAISFYSIRYKLYPRIHTSILCHPVSRLRPASQSVRRGPASRQPGRRPAGTECRLIDFIAVFELRTLPKGSFPLCIGMFDYKPKICYLPGRKTNLDLIKKPCPSDEARFGLNFDKKITLSWFFSIFWCVVFVVRKSYSLYSIICSCNISLSIVTGTGRIVTTVTYNNRKL